MSRQYLIEVRDLNDLGLLAARLAAVLSRACTGRGVEVSLEGELGAGKTTLTRKIAELLGSREPVSSPSFVLEHEYHCRDNLLIEHWDLYRLACLPDELIEPPVANAIRLVEWGNKVEGFVERCDLRVVIGFSAAGPAAESRVVVIEGRLGAEIQAA